MKRILTILFFLALTACNLPGSSTQCAYVEGRKDVEKLSDEITQKLKDVAVPIEMARAEAYGENCVASDGSTVRFAQKEVDFYITLNITSLKDETDLGNQLEQIVLALNQLSPNEIGPNPGYVSVTFQSAGQVENLWFTLKDATALQKQGTKGADLYAALRKKP